VRAKQFFYVWSLYVAHQLSHTHVIIIITGNIDSVSLCLVTPLGIFCVRDNVVKKNIKLCFFMGNRKNVTHLNEIIDLIYARSIYKKSLLIYIFFIWIRYCEISSLNDTPWKIILCYFYIIVFFCDVYNSVFKREM